MSKYKALLGLAKDVLPTGERVLVHEGDDLLRALHGLDEREIESMVSQMDAIQQAARVKRDLINKLAPNSRLERMEIRKKFNDSYMNNSPISVGGINFPEEYASHLDPEEVELLSKQWKNNVAEERNAVNDRFKLRRKLQELNPDEYENIFDATHRPGLGSIAEERFQKIRDAMKAKK